MIEGRCGWCCERIQQAETGRPREFCSDAHRVAYNRRKAGMPPEWDAATEPIWQPLNQAEEEALARYEEVHPPAPPQYTTEAEFKRRREENRRIIRARYAAR